jgi:hypothetical protein
MLLSERLYNETNVMHFLCNLLRIKGLYMFRTLLAHPQESLQSGTWYSACVLCPLTAPGAANRNNTHAIYQVPFVQRILRMSK